MTRGLIGKKRQAPRRQQATRLGRTAKASLAAALTLCCIGLGKAFVWDPVAAQGRDVHDAKMTLRFGDERQQRQAIVRLLNETRDNVQALQQMLESADDTMKPHVANALTSLQRLLEER